VLLAAPGTIVVAVGMALAAGTLTASADRTVARPASPPSPARPSIGAPAPPMITAPPGPSWAAGLPADTTQVIRTNRSNRWCSDVFCTNTEAWEKVNGVWRVAAGPGRGGRASFRSTIGPNGFAPVGQRREDDGRTPTGVFAIVITFSTTTTAPGPMPWRRRTESSVIGSDHDGNYNTWLENGSGGDRPSMEYGFWLDYNHPRLSSGVGPAPDPALGSGIFYHTSWPSTRWLPTYGCVNVSLPDQMGWLVAWLRPSANPRVLNNI